MLAVACSSTAAETTDQTSLFGNELTIKTENSACYLYTDGPLGKNKHRLTPKPPCHFLRRGEGVQHYAYKEKDIEAVLAIAGTPMSEEDLRDLKLLAGTVCGLQYQGVIFKKDSIAVSKHTLEAGACRDYGLDKKFFYPFAHEEWFKTMEERSQRAQELKQHRENEKKSNK